MPKGPSYKQMFLETKARLDALEANIASKAPPVTQAKAPVAEDIWQGIQADKPAAPVALTTPLKAEIKAKQYLAEMPGVVFAYKHRQFKTVCIGAAPREKAYFRRKYILPLGLWDGKSLTMLKGYDKLSMDEIGKMLEAHLSA